MAAANAQAKANLYLETGQCPLALDMENFLKGLVDSNIQPNGLLLNLPTYSMPYLTAGIYNAQVNPGFDLANAGESPKSTAVKPEQIILNYKLILWWAATALPLLLY